MRTEAHWLEGEHVLSHREANRVALQLKELAKATGYDPRGVKVLSKRQIIDRGYGRAGSGITWLEGPLNWANDIEPFVIEDVCVTAHGNIIIFYDI